MVVAIHQPNFLPYVGYFYKIYKADKFIILDDVQYTKNNFINRNRIKTENGAKWLTVPVVAGNETHIRDVYIKDAEYNKKKICKTIKQYYRRSANFNSLYPALSRLIEGDPERRLIDLNVLLILWSMDVLGIRNTLLIPSSSLGVSGTKTERLVKLIKKVGGTEYIPGGDSANYHDKDMFKDAGIKLHEWDFVHPQYEQMQYKGVETFIPNLSIIDYLFNYEGDYKEQW